MAKPEYPSISEIAAGVLRSVDAEDQIKTAETQMLREALQPPPPPRTELARELRKLASECRQQTSELTYADLQQFLEQTNAG